MKYLGRKDILEAKDEQFKDVDVPEWGGKVKVRSLTGAQRAVLLNSAQEIQAAEWVERMAAACICDENGNPLFTPEDVKALSQKNAAALQRIFEAADELNAISSREIDNIAGE